ncbi:hypothetical protein CesoFtcFv8_020125 [Champsocephalus esox]|uniref:Uncharacterized protein n=1 Tax=Champsocephalus esox TaxID=159716 RepID=A0AAN8BG25_9TELE|nr:hypothetical protein CesoFtcFv8_020125 [Champsocephalus esox]
MRRRRRSRLVAVRLQASFLTPPPAAIGYSRLLSRRAEMCLNKPTIQGMHAELSLAEISPAVRHASTVPRNASAEEPWRNHQCILGYSSSREPPRRSILGVHLEK